MIYSVTQVRKDFKNLQVKKSGKAMADVIKEVEYPIFNSSRAEADFEMSSKTTLSSC